MDDPRWTGGFYQLNLELEDSSVAEDSIRAMWSHPALQGCYQSPEIDFSEQERMDPLDTRIGLEDARFGVGSLEHGRRVCLRSGVLRIDGEPSSLWLGIPMGSLASVYAVGAYPFPDDSNLSWREALDDWMIDIARRVHRARPIALGLVGWEADDLIDAEPPALARVVAANGVPSARWASYLLPVKGGLEVYPCNTGAAVTFEPPES